MSQPSETMSSGKYSLLMGCEFFFFFPLSLNLDIIVRTFSISRSLASSDMTVDRLSIDTFDCLRLGLVQLKFLLFVTFDDSSSAALLLSN